MRYDEYDDYSNRSGRDSRSRSSYDRGSSRSGYDRDARSSGSGRSGGYDRGYDSGRRAGSQSGYGSDRGAYGGGRDYDYGRGSGGYSDYDRGYGQSYDRYGGRTRPSYDSFDEESWRRTAPNWVDHSEPDPPPRRRSDSRSGSGRRDDRRSSQSSRSRSDYDRRSSSRSRSDYDRDRRGGDRRRSQSDRRRYDSRNRRPAQRGMNPIPLILLLVVVAVLVVVLVHTVLGSKGSDKYSITFSSQNIVVGDTAEATLNGVEKASSAEVVWSSGDNNVVSVSGDGVVCTLTAKSTGTATIAATMDGETVASGSVIVVDTAPGVEDIRVDEESVSIEAGSQYTIKATVVMEKDDMDPARIRWTSSDSDVASVSDSGVIEGRQVGQAIVKGTAGEKTVELVVNVTENTSNTKHDGTGNVGQEPEEGVTIPAEADSTVDPNNSEIQAE